MRAFIDAIRRHAQFAKPTLLPWWFCLQRTRTWYEFMRQVRRRRSQRALQAFCIGLPKTGTHSVAKMMTCRGDHEPETHTLLHLYQQYESGLLSQTEVKRVLEARDTWLWLELESNWMLGLVLAPLCEAFPEARYILPVREPISWLESEISQEYAIGRTEPYVTTFSLMFGRGGGRCHQHGSGVNKYGLYKVKDYFQYWKNYHQKVLQVVPRKQLIIVKTSNLSQEAEQISDFIGAGSVAGQSAHSYARKEKPLRLSEVFDMQYVNECARRITASTYQELEERRQEVI